MVISCKKKCKKRRSTMLTVEQMVDIALGTPEVGAVNFNVLHALIHVIIQQLNIQKCLVEFKGLDSERMEGLILSAKPGPILKLSEYIIDTGEGKPCPIKAKRGYEEDEDVRAGLSSKKGVCECKGEKKRKDTAEEAWEAKRKEEKTKAESDSEERKREETKIKTEEECDEYDEEEPKKVREVKYKACPCKKAAEGTQIIDDETKAATSSYYGSDSEGACQTIVRVEPVGERCDTWRSKPALAHESMVKLEEKVAMLQDAFEALEQMPTNEELKKRTQSSGGPGGTPVKDLWQMFNLTKRIESCECTIEKMATMIEDLVKDTCNFKEAMLVIADAVDEMECADQTSKFTCCAAIQSQTGNPFAASASNDTKEKKPFVSFQKHEEDTRCNGGPCPDEVKEGQGSPQEGAETEDGGTRKSGDVNQADLKLHQHVDGDGTPLQALGIGPEFYKMSAAKKFCVLKENINCLICQFKNMMESLPTNQIASKLCALISMQKQLDSLDKDWKEFIDTFGAEGVTGVHTTIDTFKSELETLTTMMEKLMSENKETEMTLRSVVHEIENLKRVKADFEIMEDLLAEKADASVVNRKVSHDQFDAACDDLTRGLDETLEKLLQQEAMWNEAMEELQRDVDNKLDKNEIMPLKEFINKKLKSLQDKLKQLAQLRKDAETAGAKTRILRNLNCIACDGDVVMKMDNFGNYTCPPMPPSKNMKPMLTFELDQVRKAMKKGPCKATTHVEEAVMDAQKKLTGIPLTQKEMVDSKISKLAHFCNRYCGGSHTITTPQQRVTRIGHFLTEFGPQAMAMFNQENYETRNPHCPNTQPVQPPPEEDLFTNK